MVEAYVTTFEELSQKRVDELGYISEFDGDVLILENMTPKIYIDDNINSMRKGTSFKKILENLQKEEYEVLYQKEKKPKNISVIKYNGYRKVAEEASEYLPDPSILVIKNYWSDRDLYTTKIGNKTRVNIEQRKRSKSAIIEGIRNPKSFL